MPQKTRRISTDQNSNQKACERNKTRHHLPAQHNARRVLRPHPRDHQRTDATGPTPHQRGRPKNHGCQQRHVSKSHPRRNHQTPTFFNTLPQMAAQPDLIIVTAVIRFRTTAEGGRMTPVKSGYRPNHVFERKPDELTPPDIYRRRAVRKPGLHATWRNTDGNSPVPSQLCCRTLCPSRPKVVDKRRGKDRRRRGNNRNSRRLIRISFSPNSFQLVSHLPWSYPRISEKSPFSSLPAPPSAVRFNAGSIRAVSHPAATRFVTVSDRHPTRQPLPIYHTFCTFFPNNLHL